MKRLRLAAASLVAAAIIFGLPKAVPVKAMSINCGDAEKMMLQAHALVAARTPSTEGLDKEFFTMELALTKAQYAMASVESACGRKQGMKSAADVAMHEAEERMRLFRNQGTSL